MDEIKIYRDSEQQEYIGNERGNRVSGDNALVFLAKKLNELMLIVERLDARYVRR